MKIFNPKYDLPGWEEPKWYEYEFQPDMTTSNYLIHPAYRLEAAAGTINFLQERIKRLEAKIKILGF